MQAGDLSNKVPPRALFIFENTIGRYTSPAAALKEKTYLRLRRWKKAVDCWEIPEHAMALLWDCAWRWDVRFDVVTFRPQGFAEELQALLDADAIPFSNIWASTPEKLARKLSFMPDVLYVYDADPAHKLTYGNKGRYMPDGLAMARELW